jgi:hypothetical protein
MRRFLHLVAILALIGSALYAYRIKYDTIFLAEQVAKLKNRAAREREAIAVLRAEWQFSAKPDRVQALADRHLPDLQPGAIQQIARWSEIVARPVPVDPFHDGTTSRQLRGKGPAQPAGRPGDHHDLANDIEERIVVHGLPARLDSACLGA